MTPSRLTTIAIMAAGLCGCASLASVSSGHVGCAAREITITDDQGGWGTRTWTAHCRGMSYYCSAHAGGQSEQVACRPAQFAAPAPARVPVAAAPAPAPPAAVPAPAPPSSGGDGCKYDTQCKGDRLCRAGTCVDP